MAVWQLSDIRAEVRNLTKRQSANQISNADINTKINRFYTQRLPSLLDLKSIESWWRFHTNTNVESYPIPNDSFTVRGPAYVNGTPMEVFTDAPGFYDQYPQTFATSESIGTGDAATVNFTGNLSKTPVSYRRLVIDDDTETMRVFEDDVLLEQASDFVITNISQASPAAVTTDKAHGLASGLKVQIIEVNGMDEINGFITTITVTSTTAFTLAGVDSTNFTAYESGGKVIILSQAQLTGDKGGSGTVTSSDGAFDVTFNSAPASGQDIRANYEFWNAGIPVAALHYEKQLWLSPVPDKVYHIEIPIMGRPAPLSDDNDGLANNDWGELIAYGTALDILNKFGDQQTASLIKPEFDSLLSQARYVDIRNTEDSRVVPRF